MGDTLERKVFEVSRDVTNGTSQASVGTPDLLDNDESWSLFLSVNSSHNGSMLDGNKTSAADFQRDEELAKVEMAILALIFILTVLGNCIVLLGIFFRRQKMTRMYYFILHLSFADLITAFFNVLTQLFWEITYRFQGGNFLCKFVKYTQILGPYSSSYVLVMTALDRYQAICYPLSNCTWTAKRSKVMLGLAWAISFLFCVPQLFIFSYQLVTPGTETKPPVYDCWATFPAPWIAKAYVTWYSITVFIVPLIILVFAYSCITRAIWINFNMKAASRNHDNYEKKITRQDSDDGDGASTYDQSQSQSQEDSASVFQREGRLSLRANASHSISGNTPPTKKSNVNLYNTSKNFLTAKSSTSSTSRVESGTSSKDSKKRGNRKGGNNRITTRTSTSSCTTQSSTLSPSLSSRRLSATDDKAEQGKNALCFNSQKMFTFEEDGFHQQHHDHQREEQLQLIEKDGERNELRNISRGCHAERNDLEGNVTRTPMKNGSVKFSEASDVCQHGCFEKRCNFCHSPCEDPARRRYSTDGTNVKESPGSIIVTEELMEQTRKEAKDIGGSAGDRDKETNQSYRFSGKSSSRHLLLPSRPKFSKRWSKGAAGNSTISGSGSNQQDGKSNTKALVTTSAYANQQPRTHSMKGISRAKIKTIKLTVTIICCYIFCSSPFIAAQLWYVYDPYAAQSSFSTGPTFTILTLLASLNSCVNPYIFLFFNPNLLQNCFRGIFRPKFPARRFNNGSSPLTRTLSQNKNKSQLVTRNSVSKSGSGSTSSGVLRRSGTRATQGDGSPACTTSMNHLSPLISREKQRSYQVPVNNGFEKGYLEKLSERKESANAVELVDSVAPINCSSQKDDYSSFGGAQPCRVETALVGTTTNHVITLIT